MDQIINMSTDNALKVHFIAQKGEISQIEGKFPDAIKYYKKSLAIEFQPSYPFYDDIKNNLKECIEKLNEHITD